MLLTTYRELSFQPQNFAMLFVGTMVSGNIDSLNYADNNGICDQS